MNGDCIFCKILAGTVPCRKVHEDPWTLAFLDVNPLTEGHTLVIPRNHVALLEDLSEEENARLFAAVSRVNRLLVNALDPVATTVGINNGVGAGQVVPHVHVHVVPRYADDGGTNIHAVVHQAEQRPLGTIEAIVVGSNAARRE